MKLTLWNPGNDLFGTHREMSKMMDRFFSPDLFGEMMFNSSGWLPGMDVAEDKDKFTVNVELPGLSKDDVNITFKEGVLTIEGERKKENDKKDADFHIVERSYGKFRRSFSLPVPVKENKIDATFKEGVLTIALPKAEEVKAKKINVKVD